MASTNSTHRQIQRIVTIACLSALAFILMLFEFPVIPVVSYLKIDLSDIPVLIGTFIYGPAIGILIALLKCLLHGMVRGFSVGELIGLLADLVSSISLLLPFAWAWKHRQWTRRKQLVVGSVAATITLTILMSLLNLFVLTPLYMKLWHWQSTLPIPKLIAFGVVPFNLIKGVLISALVSLIVVRLWDWLRRQQSCRQ